MILLWANGVLAGWAAGVAMAAYYPPANPWWVYLCLSAVNVGIGALIAFNRRDRT